MVQAQIRRKLECECRLLAHFGHGAMSDLSPLCASKRMSANGRVYEPSPTRTASWQLSMRGFEGLNSSCGRFAPNQSHCPVPATKQPDGQNFTFAVGQITFRTPAILSPRKGRWPSSRTLGWDAVDAAVSSVKFVRRAVFRERATARRTYDAEAYGEVVWS
jgi:hypothetical protein